MTTRSHLLIPTLFFVILLGVACQAPVPAPAAAPDPTAMPASTDTPEPEPVTEPDHAPAAAPAPLGDTELAAQSIAAETLDVDADAVTIVAVEAVDWNDSSLGCPEPDMMYAQVITPGYRVIVEVDDEQHEVHMNASGFGVLCGQAK